MKKIFAILASLMFSVGVFAETKPLPKESIKALQAIVGNELEVQVAYAANSWEDVYKKTDTRKYSWAEGNSGYDPGISQFCLFLVKVREKTTGICSWLCWEYPGDGTYTIYYKYF